jgi:hypothetical protein
LNLQKMYDMYIALCSENETVAVKLHAYRDIFNTHFNLSFVKPKKDRCDLCEEFVCAQKNDSMTERLNTSQNSHITSKDATMKERKIDREMKTAVICFDLQNVITLPRANISNMFYKRKLNMYNLTGHFSENKQGFAVLWHEGQSGRAGNDIASALTTMLSKVIEQNPDITELVLWSDSCVPQNRNSLMSLALINFLKSQTTLVKITQKFCEPGHSSIQEVDNIHSQIEKTLQLTEIFSPLGLTRLMLTANRKKPLKVIQMSSTNFINYQKVAKSASFQFSLIPYNKVKMLVHSKEKLCCVQYKTHFDEENCVTVCIRKECQCSREDFQLPELESSQQVNSLSKEKVADLKSMFIYMPSTDKELMETIIASSESKEKGNSRTTSKVVHSAKRAQSSASKVSVVFAKTRSR